MNRAYLQNIEYAYLYNTVRGGRKRSIQNLENPICHVYQRNFTRYSNKGNHKKGKSLVFFNSKAIINRLNKFQDRLKIVYYTNRIYPDNYKHFLQNFIFRLNNKYHFFKNKCQHKLLKYKSTYDINGLLYNVRKSEKRFRYFLNNLLIQRKFILNKISYSVQNINTSYYKNLFWYYFNQTPITYTLIFLHLLVFLLWLKAKPVNYDWLGRYDLSKGLTTNFMYKYFCCSVQNLREKKLYTLLTCLVSHNTIQSFLLNTLSLYYIGRSLEVLINSKNFITTYLISGLISTYLQIAFYKNQYSDIYVFGASGSISSILMTYTFMYPKQNIYLYGLIALPLALFSGLYFLNELYCVLTNRKDNTGHISHLSGMGLGVLYYYYIRRRMIL